MGIQKCDQGALRDMITVLSGLGTRLSVTFAEGLIELMEPPSASCSPTRTTLA